jgi:hypothetical protein
MRELIIVLTRCNKKLKLRILYIHAVIFHRQVIVLTKHDCFVKPNRTSPIESLAVIGVRKGVRTHNLFSAVEA